jgi:DNA-binding NtrC family response regulator
MIGIGAILGEPDGMKPATCAIDVNLQANGASRGREPLEHFPGDADSFPRCVLVIDDEPLIRWSVSETLSDLGYVVQEAPDAGTALRSVTTAKRPFEIVVLDLRLPDMKDLSLLGTLRQLLPGAALILMTAFGTEEIIRDAQALGAAVLLKPFELDELKRLVSGSGTEAS